MMGSPLAVLPLLLAALMPQVFGQSMQHQRVAVETEARNSVELGAGCGWQPQAAGWALDADAYLEYSFRNTLAFCLDMPIEGAFKSEERPRFWSWSWGDPSATLSWLWRGQGLRLQAALGYVQPLDFRGNRGFRYLTSKLSLGLVRDPAILAVGLEGKVGLPRAMRGHLLWRPFSGAVSLSAWELLNDRISYCVSVSPGLSLGTRRLGLGERMVPAWTLGLAFTVSWNTRHWGASAGWSGSAQSAGTSMAALNLRGTAREEW
jgi:hypothetical protein